jgi:hypothetical protein
MSDLNDDKHEKAPDADAGVSVECGSDLTNVQLDAAKEKKLLAKLDMAFVPVIMFAYLSCFLDRSNIGTSYSPYHILQTKLTRVQETSKSPACRKISEPRQLNSLLPCLFSMLLM